MRVSTWKILSLESQKILLIIKTNKEIFLNSIKFKCYLNSTVDGWSSWCDRSHVANGSKSKERWEQRRTEAKIEREISARVGDTVSERKRRKWGQLCSSKRHWFQFRFTWNSTMLLWRCLLRVKLVLSVEKPLPSMCFRDSSSVRSGCICTMTI